MGGASFSTSEKPSLSTSSSSRREHYSACQSLEGPSLCLWWSWHPNQSPARCCEIFAWMVWELHRPHQLEKAGSLSQDLLMLTSVSPGKTQHRATTYLQVTLVSSSQLMLLQL
ncbi:hypothetical protein E2C01_016156 [Portunus trituberculatus]|uniref:Uncharacterized protein n=1 Tax=Portunus trituberculatus TaxID=210409 RepID=A0A5B7DNT7_PORTR|nr:hypothetical protein [Portunus trituberculatus]